MELLESFLPFPPLSRTAEGENKWKFVFFFFVRADGIFELRKIIWK